MIFDFIIAGTPSLRADRHRLGNSVTLDGSPGSQLVVVMDRVTFSLVAAVWSDSAGAWEISGIPEYPEGMLMVLGVDQTGNYNSVVSDRATQVAA